MTNSPQFTFPVRTLLRCAGLIVFLGSALSQTSSAQEQTVSTQEQTASFWYRLLPDSTVESRTAAVIEFSKDDTPLVRVNASEVTEQDILALHMALQSIYKSKGNSFPGNGRLEIVRHKQLPAITESELANANARVANQSDSNSLPVERNMKIFRDRQQAGTAEAKLAESYARSTTRFIKKFAQESIYRPDRTPYLMVSVVENHLRK